MSNDLLREVREARKKQEVWRKDAIERIVALSVELGWLKPGFAAANSFLDLSDAELELELRVREDALRASAVSRELIRRFGK